MKSKYELIANTHLIGIGHKCRQGKDVTAGFIIQKCEGAVKFSFANALYTVARALFGMTEKDPLLLQALGTEVGRRNDPDRWIRTLYYQIKDASPRVAILPDVRFPNEAEFVQEMGGTLINVQRWNEDGTRFIAEDRDPNHPSEIALEGYDGWNYIINASSGRLDTIKTSVDTILTHLGL